MSFIQKSWIAYWQSEGCKIELDGGRVRYQPDLILVDDQWLDVTHVVAGIKDAAGLSELASTLEEYAIERYCPRCETLWDPEDIECDGEDVLCSECVLSKQDSEERGRDVYAYHGVSRSDF